MPDYDAMTYRRCGESGLMLPLLSLGLWHNFGGVDDLENARAILRHAFDRGITHFDLANNYGPPPGSAEENFGKILKSDLAAHRDELIISTKAGYLMWDGPYGNGGSRKYLLASLDQSLQRMGLDYVDIFYSHRPDPETPLEETMGALASAIDQGKALYVGISNYSADQTRRAARVLRDMGHRLLIHQPPYNMFHRTVDGSLGGSIDSERIGCIVFSPLAQGLLTGRYLDGIPEDSRAAKEHGFLKPERVHELHEQIVKLNEIAQNAGRSLAQLALAWVLRDRVVTSALMGVSRVSQLDDNLAILGQPELDRETLHAIEDVVGRE